jgi:hypothetical protein
MQSAAASLAQSFEVGLLQRTPIPNMTSEQSAELSIMGKEGFGLSVNGDYHDEFTHFFVVPALTMCSFQGTLGERIRSFEQMSSLNEKSLNNLRNKIGAIVSSLYHFTVADQRAIADSLHLSSEPDSSQDEDKEDKIQLVAAQHEIRNMLSYTIGCAIGRWDIRYATGERQSPELPDPFAPLPICPPGMLQNAEGLPAELADVSADYPLRISWGGILVDDPGFNGGQLHQKDIVRRVREVLDLIWKDKAADIEQETCDILSVSDLRAYFRKSFFADHIKRYSKSRRKAPIYWQLATPSGSYAVWVYYHRFSKDTFYKILNDYAAPKLQLEERELINARAQYGAIPTAGQRKELAARETFVAELNAFKDEVARIAPLWNPDLNDGVIINFAPLWRLVPQNRAWQKECKTCWDKLVAGDYDWAHLAMHLWPERIVPKCVKDRSLAIAHGLDAIFWEEDDKGKSRSKKVDRQTVEGLIAARTSPAVKAALESLIKAPDLSASTTRNRKKKT